MNKEIRWDVTLDLRGELVVCTMFNGKRYRAYVYVDKTGPENIPYYKDLIEDMKAMLLDIIETRNTDGISN